MVMLLHMAMERLSAQEIRIVGLLLVICLSFFRPETVEAEEMDIRRQLAVILMGAAIASAGTVNMRQIRGYSRQADPASYGLPGSKVTGGVDKALDKADQYANMPRSKAVEMENRRHEAVMRRIDDGIANAKQKVTAKTGGCRRLPMIARESCEAGVNSAFQRAFKPFEVARAQEMNLYRTNMARIQRLPV